MSNHDGTTSNAMTTVPTTPHPKQETSTMQIDTSTTNDAKPAAAKTESRKKTVKAKKMTKAAKPRPARGGHPMTAPRWSNPCGRASPAASATLASYWSHVSTDSIAAAKSFPATRAAMTASPTRA